MRPCPVCTKIVKAIAGITALADVDDDLKLFLIGACIDYEPPAFRKKRRKRRAAPVVKLIPKNDPPAAS
jgi:hypothetical protein